MGVGKFALDDRKVKTCRNAAKPPSNVSKIILEHNLWHRRQEFISGIHCGSITSLLFYLFM